MDDITEVLRHIAAQWRATSARRDERIVELERELEAARISAAAWERVAKEQYKEHIRWRKAYAALNESQKGKE